MVCRTTRRHRLHAPPRPPRVFCGLAADLKATCLQNAPAARPERYLFHMWRRRILSASAGRVDHLGGAAHSNLTRLRWPRKICRSWHSVTPHNAPVSRQFEHRMVLGEAVSNRWTNTGAIGTRRCAFRANLGRRRHTAQTCDCTLRRVSMVTETRGSMQLRCAKRAEISGADFNRMLNAPP